MRQGIPSGDLQSKAMSRHFYFLELTLRSCLSAPASATSHFRSSLWLLKFAFSPWIFLGNCGSLVWPYHLSGRAFGKVGNGVGEFLALLVVCRIFSFLGICSCWSLSLPTAAPWISWLLVFPYPHPTSFAVPVLPPPAFWIYAVHEVPSFAYFLSWHSLSRTLHLLEGCYPHLYCDKVLTTSPDLLQDSGPYFQLS